MVFVLANMTPVVPDHAAEAESPEDCADAVFAHNAANRHRSRSKVLCELDADGDVRLDV